MNYLMCYIIVWIISFFFPSLIYLIMCRIRKENTQGNQNKMPFFNKFSIILLSIFSSLNVVMFHLIILSMQSNNI